MKYLEHTIPPFGIEISRVRVFQRYLDPKGVLILLRRWKMAALIILGILGGGAAYWSWDTFHTPSVLAQPSIQETREENANREKEVERENLRTDQDSKSIGTSDLKNELINILVLGTDNLGENVGRTDSMMLVTANVKTKRVSILSIPRDTRVNIPGVGLTKINHANAIGESKGGLREGTLESARAVSNLLGVTINYFVKVNFQGFEKVIDTLGGIDVTLPNAVDDELRNIHLSAGEHHLSGDEALRLARARYGLKNGDFDRQKNQFYLFSAVAYEMLDLTNITKLPEEINVIQQELMDTNLSISKMAMYGLAFKGISEKNIKYFQLPGQGISAFDPLVGSEVYYYESDQAGVKKIVLESLAWSTEECY